MNKETLRNYFENKIKGKPTIVPLTEVRLFRHYIYRAFFFNVEDTPLWKVNELCKAFGWELEGKKILVSEVFTQR